MKKGALDSYRKERNALTQKEIEKILDQGASGISPLLYQMEGHFFFLTLILANAVIKLQLPFMPVWTQEQIKSLSLV